MQGGRLGTVLALAGKKGSQPLVSLGKNIDAHLTTFIPQIKGIHNWWGVNLGLVIDAVPMGISKPHRFAFSEISSRTPPKK